MRCLSFYSSWVYFPLVHEHNYDSCFKILVCWYQHLVYSKVELFSWKWVKSSYFLICWVLLIVSWTLCTLRCGDSEPCWFCYCFILPGNSLVWIQTANFVGQQLKPQFSSSALSWAVLSLLLVCVFRNQPEIWAESYTVLLLLSLRAFPSYLLVTVA